MKVLVVEDDGTYGPALCRSLVRLGYEPTLRTSIADTLQEEAFHPLALVDLALPDGSGEELVSALRADGTRVVMLTGHGSIPAAVQCMQHGAVDFLTKPVASEEVRAALERAMGVSMAPAVGSERLDDVEKAHIQAVLEDCGGNVSEAARRLGLYRRTLQRKLQKL